MPTTTSTRPAGVFTAEQEELLDWLAANDINEYVPEGTVFTVTDGWIRYQSFVWAEGSDRGWNHNIKVVGDEAVYDRLQPFQFGARGDAGQEAVLLEQRTLPLRRPVTDRIRQLFAAVPLLHLAEERFVEE